MFRGQRRVGPHRRQRRLRSSPLTLVPERPESRFYGHQGHWHLRPIIPPNALQFASRLNVSLSPALFSVRSVGPLAGIIVAMGDNIILTGFMGTGKSTVGPLLAAATGRTFVDTDSLIAARAGKSVAAIFAEDGEPGFRAWERGVAGELSQQDNLVVATGGGMLLDEDNRRLLEASGRVICLTAPVEAIVARLTDDPAARPLLTGDDPARQVAALLATRAPLYDHFPQIDTGGRTPERVLEEILDLLAEVAIELDTMERLIVRHSQGQYPVVVGHGLLPQLVSLAGLAAQPVGVLALVTDTHVGPIHAARLPQVNVTITIPAGESHKNLETVREVYERLLAAGCDRQTTVVALGGGVVGDLAGFVAATFLRGVAYVACPTTLLAMVDASIGGKVGVDLPQGKNLVGAFKQPRAVVADLDTLKTLPAEEWQAGLAEVAKHGLLADAALLDTLSSGPATRERLGTPAFLARVIEVKKAYVESDPLEQGRRAHLNLGHTFAHALERLSQYRLRHGEAVAIGLVAAADLSHRLGFAGRDLVDTVRELLRHLGLPVTLPVGQAPPAVIAAMSHDKKRLGGRHRFVLLERVGAPFVADDIPESAVLATLTELQPTRSP